MFGEFIMIERAGLFVLAYTLACYPFITGNAFGFFIPRRHGVCGAFVTFTLNVVRTKGT